MAELERLTVVLETRLTGYTRGMRAAAKQALGLASDIEKAGDRADASAKKAEGAFARVSRAIREARTEANRGAEFKVSADERPAGGPRSGPWPSARAGILSRMQPHERRRRLYQIRLNTVALREASSLVSPIGMPLSDTEDVERSSRLGMRTRICLRRDYLTGSLRPRPRSQGVRRLGDEAVGRHPGPRGLLQRPLRPGRRLGAGGPEDPPGR